MVPRPLLEILILDALRHDLMRPELRLTLDTAEDLRLIRAVFEALFHKPSEFVRTPKYAVEGASDEWSQKKYRQAVSVQPLIEVALGKPADALFDGHPPLVWKVSATASLAAPATFMPSETFARTV